MEEVDGEEIPQGRHTIIDIIISNSTREDIYLSLSLKEFTNSLQSVTTSNHLLMSLMMSPGLPTEVTCQSIGKDLTILLLRS